LNPSATEVVHLYQIWLFPEEKGLEPSYEQRLFSSEERQGRWQMIASGDGQHDSLKIHQDARVYLAGIEQHMALAYELHNGRGAWLQVIRGQVDLHGNLLSSGDGVAISDEPFLDVTASDSAEVMLFDLA